MTLEAGELKIVLLASAQHLARGQHCKQLLAVRQNSDILTLSAIF